MYFIKKDLVHNSNSWMEQIKEKDPFKLCRKSNFYQEKFDVHRNIF